MSIDDEALREHRRRNFAVEVKDVGLSEMGEPEMRVSVTRNGTTWHGIRLMPDEARQVVAAINSELERVAYRLAKKEVV